MKSWRHVAARAAVSGSLASLTSTLVLLLLGERENGRPLGPVNAPSHWVWGERALRQDGASARYTATGFAIHHLASLLWGGLHERYSPCRQRRDAPARLVLRDAAVVTTLAAAVDLKLVAPRLAPGFERRLSPPAVFCVYGAFALGLVAGHYLLERQAAGRCKLVSSGNKTSNTVSV